MAGDVHHVVDPAEQPEVTIVVAACAVTGDVGLGSVFREVGLDVAVGVAPDRPRDRGPGMPQYQEPTGAQADRCAALVDHVGLDPGDGSVAEPGFNAVRPGSGVI